MNAHTQKVAEIEAAVEAFAHLIPQTHEMRMNAVYREAAAMTEWVTAEMHIEAILGRKFAGAVNMPREVRNTWRLTNTADRILHLHIAVERAEREGP